MKTNLFFREKHKHEIQLCRLSGILEISQKKSVESIQTTVHANRDGAPYQDYYLFSPTTHTEFTEKQHFTCLWQLSQVRIGISA